MRQLSLYCKKFGCFRAVDRGNPIKSDFMNLLPIAKVLGVTPRSLRGIYMKYYPDEEVDMMMEDNHLGFKTIPIRPLIEFQKKLKKRVVSHFQYAIGFNQQELSRVLHIDTRTIQRYKKDAHSALPIEVSDRVVALASLLVKGLEVFEDKEAFYGWLNDPNEALEYQKPIVLLESTLGINQVMTELGRIEHGIFA